MRKHGSVVGAEGPDSFDLSKTCSGGKFFSTGP